MLLFNPKNHEYNSLLDSKINQEIDIFNSSLELNFKELEFKKETCKYYPRNYNEDICIDTLEEDIENLKDDDFKTNRIDNYDFIIEGNGWELENYNIEHNYNLNNKNILTFKKGKYNNSINFASNVITEDFFYFRLTEVIDILNCIIFFHIIIITYSREKNKENLSDSFWFSGNF